MTSRASESIWGDSIDLRKLIAFLLRQWQIILGCVGIFASGAAIFSFIIQPTVYQSTTGVIIPLQPTVNQSTISMIIPPPTIGSEFGFTPQAYLAFASSTQTLELIRQQLGLRQTVGELRNQLSFALENEAFLAVSATAETAEEAFLLADTWSKAYPPQAIARIQNRYTQSLDQANQMISTLQPQLIAKEDALERLKVQNYTALLEIQKASLTRLSISRLNSLEGELVASENRLRQLSLISIPKSESAVTLLEERLESTEEFLDLQPIDGSPINNPVYFVWGRLIDAQLQLATQRREEQALSEKIADFESENLALKGIPIPEAEQISQIEEINNEIIIQKIAIRSLEAEINQISTEYNLAMTEYMRLAHLEDDINSLAQIFPVREPALPNSPISPQRIRNITLAIFVGLVTGVGVAVIRDFYRGTTSRPSYDQA